MEPCPVKISPSPAVYPIAALSPAAVSPSALSVPAVRSPTTSTFVAPVAIVITSASASFLIVTSFVEPCPVKIRPSADVYPIAALSLAAVSPSGSKVVAVTGILKSADACP